MQSLDYFGTTYISQMELGETGSAVAALWLKGHFDTLGMETCRRAMGVARVQYVTCHRTLTHTTALIL